jgi:hypothetical protein
MVLKLSLKSVTWLLFLSLVCYSCYLVTKVKEEWESQQCPRYEPMGILTGIFRPIREEVTQARENYTLKSFSICSSHDILLG